MDMRVVVIDDDEVYLNLIERRFRLEPDMEILAIKAEIGSVVNKARTFNPDVVLVDLKMPHLYGGHLIPLMKKKENLPRARYIILSGGDATELRRVAKETGADEAFSKSTDLKHLVQLIRSYESWVHRTEKEIS
jgi:DNA-binding NarL/FixJ family response regulator